MRIPSDYRTTITDTAANVFGERASVWLFGSRLNDAAKGGCGFTYKTRLAHG